MVEKVLSLGKRYQLAIAWAHDENTIGSVYRAVNAGFADAILIGRPYVIKKLCKNAGFKESDVNIVEADNETKASEKAVQLAGSGAADIVMKGLVSTDKFLKAVMDKEHGLMLPGAVLSYVCALQLPEYHKLIFITDPAVIPYPDLDQKIAMAQYAISMTKQFGIEKPKIALIGPSEKISHHFGSSTDYAVMCKMADRGQLGDCIMDGPLDVFLACDAKSAGIKGIQTPVNGDADILLFPSLESSNPFYKALMLFAGGELAGLIQGTKIPVVLMSRSESEKSKFYCIALACLMT